MVLDRFYNPRFNDLVYARQETRVRTAAFVSTKQLWQATRMQRVSRNAVYMCRGSKDTQLLDTEKVVTRLPCVYRTRRPSCTK